MWYFLGFLILATRDILAHGEKPTVLDIPAGECFQWCWIPLRQMKWVDLDPKLDYAGMYIANDPFMISLVAAMRTYCPDETSYEAAWHELEHYAEEAKTKIPIPSRNTLLAQAGDISALPVIDIFAPDEMTRNRTEPFLLTREAYEIGFLRMIYYSNAFGWSMFLLMALMVLVGVFNRIHHIIRSKMYASDLEGRLSSGSRLRTWYEKRLGTPAFIGDRHLQASGWGFLSIPTRIQSVLIFIYVALNFIFSFVGYDVFEKNLYWYQEKDQQVARFVADRTGIMSFYNMVLLWALAGRNDVLIWLTGWSFQSMNLFHRWTARVATLQAIVHSAAYTWISKDELAESFKELYWATGVFGTVAMSLILPFSFRPVREKMYELFLTLHILLAVATLVLMYYHVKDFGYLPWVWACVGLWAFDRFVRLLRVAVLSYRAIGECNTVARITGDADLIRVSVRSSVRFTPKPGSCYFLYEPLSLAPWENHPFTLASWSTTSKATELNFLVAPMRGWTRRLEKRVARANGPTEMHLFMEGPYGNQADLRPFEHVLLVAGGSGVTGILPHVFALEQAERKQHVHVVWSVRTGSYASDVLAQELSPEKRMHASLQLHLSRQSRDDVQDSLGAIILDVNIGSADTGSASDEKASPMASEGDVASATSKPHAATTIRIGRPDMDVVLRNAMADVIGGERLAILICGPFQMCDDMRKAVVSAYGDGPHQLPASQLVYHEEAFGW